MSRPERIERIEVDVYTIPTERPESDGTLEWDSTTIVVVEASAGGATGIGYTYAAAAVQALIEDRLAPAVTGLQAMDVRGAWNRMFAALRNVGRSGAGAMAVAAVDTALWDLKARLLDLSLPELLGRVRADVPVYGSGGFTSYDEAELQEQLGDWVERGIPAVKMKVGREPERDLRRVAAAREAIGPEATLMVDANGAYRRRQALRLAQDFVREAQVRWFEEPVSSDDLEGLRFLRDRSPAGMEIAAGEYAALPLDFRRLLEAGAVDVLMPDLTRCGGFTGFLDAAALARAFEIPLSTHTAPALHVHLGCALAEVLHLEYFHDHVRIEEMLFDGVPELEDGRLRPPRDRRGNGLELRRAAARRFAA